MPIAVADARNAVEIDRWNSTSGERWLRRQEANDELLAPVSAVLLERAAARPGERVLDVGCGCGATSIVLARQVTPGGRVLGIDVSAPLLGRARERARGLPAEFVLADATVYSFEAAGADLLCSRFGVMFFAEPVRSFTNMRRGLRRGARLAFACWRAADENPWVTVPLHAAYRHVPQLPEEGPETPGAYSLADESRVRAILTDAGLKGIGLEPVDLTLDLANGAGLDAALDTALNVGPVSRAVEGQPAARSEAATAAIRAALAQAQVGDSVPLPGAIWIVTATAP